MNRSTLRNAASAATLALLVHGAAGAQPAAAAPSFEVAYRAWDVVTDIARHNHRPEISGSCGKTFRPFVIPGLRPQGRQDQDLAAQACVTAARSVCANAGLPRTADMAKSCEEFR
jgi:hypothetical protein